MKFCVFVDREHKLLVFYLFWVSGPWRELFVITATSTWPCYITGVICDVTMCVLVCVWTCKEFITECLGDGHKDLLKRCKWRAIPSTSPPLQHETPSHIPLFLLHTVEVLVAMVILPPSSVLLHSTLFWWMSRSPLPVDRCAALQGRARCSYICLNIITLIRSHSTSSFTFFRVSLKFINPSHSSGGNGVLLFSSD